MLKTVCVCDEKTGLHGIHDNIDHKQAVEKAATSKALSLWLHGKKFVICPTFNHVKYYSTYSTLQTRKLLYIVVYR